ncbi:MAG: hypothetical protein QW468_01650 [Candidatus Bathyarchaeia archaeon]
MKLLAKNYAYFVKEYTVLPIMHMPDCISTTLYLMEAYRTSYNVAGNEFSAGELVAEIKKAYSRIYV